SLPMQALLVDGLNLVRRIYAAVPSPPEDADEAQRTTHIEGVIRSSTSSLERALRFHQPSHCVAVFEQVGPTWRHRLYPDYKKNRSPMPTPLSESMNELKKAFEIKGVQNYDRAGYEADDVIATMATKIAIHHGTVTILSTDRNYCQLLRPEISVYDHFGQRHLDREMIQKRFGVEPEQLPFLLALAGDSGLSIPGIPSIGVRTAARLVHEYHTLDNLLEASREMTGKIGSKLFNGQEIARLGLRLFTLRKDIDLGINLNQFRYQPD
ncbi:MAG: flap endonuclease Xni, partial [bacterium]